MVTHKLTANLMRLVLELTSIYEKCNALRSVQSISVKGENGILNVLKRWHLFLNNLAKNYYPNLSNVADEVKGWIEYLDKKYSEQTILLGPQINIGAGDAVKLSFHLQQWIDVIINEFEKQGPILIKEEEYRIILSKNLLSNLDELTKQDMTDALSCILHLLPTPAAMISLRVAESIVRKYYKKVTGNNPIGKSWGEMLNELEQSKKVKPSILDYLKYLKDVRNEAQHPDKRFAQEESEQLFLKVKKLIEEIKL
jgi:hypothetical protein